jgi:hypothetical protein
MNLNDLAKTFTPEDFRGLKELVENWTGTEGAREMPKTYTIYTVDEIIRDMDDRGEMLPLHFVGLCSLVKDLAARVEYLEQFAPKEIEKQGAAHDAD